MMISIDLYCPAPGCAEKARYAEDVTDDNHRLTPAAFATKAKAVAVTHGWVPVDMLPDVPIAGRQDFQRGWVVCPGHACEAIDCSRGTWTEDVGA